MQNVQSPPRAERLSWRRVTSLFDRSTAFHFVIATVFVGIAFVLRAALDPIVKNSIPFTCFVTASILSACVGGWRAGVYSMVLGWLLGDWFFVPPRGAWGVYEKAQTISLIANFVPNIIAIIALELLHRSRKAQKLADARLAHATEQIKNHNIALEREVQARTAELQTSLNFLERFCYSIAHDLRAPVRTVRGFSFALMEDYAQLLDETGKDYTRRMAAAAERMDRLINDLLDYGRLSHQRIELQTVSVREAFEVVQAALHEEIEHTGAGIETRNLDVAVYGSNYLLVDILKRLLSNALKFRRLDIRLHIQVVASSVGSVVRISVTDNGLGIEPEHLGKIFGLFETLQPSFDTGAGLAFVNKAVERMHGVCGVESMKGQGSTFWVELPKAAERPRKEPVAMEPVGQYNDSYAV